MSRVKLLHEKGTAMAEWIIKPAELKKLHAMPAPAIGRIKSPPMRIAKDELRIAPLEFSAKHLLNPPLWWPKYFCRPR